MNRVTLVALVLALTSVAQAETYQIDPAHSNVSFSIKHLVGKVAGRFDKFAGSFNYDAAKPTAWSTQATIEATSIDTGVEKRDNHLRTPDFFDVQKFPMITFKSTGITDIVGSKAKLHGDLTMRGVTKPVVLDLEFGGTAPDPMTKGMRAGASATGSISRADFGVGATTGPMAGMVGKDVTITIDIEGVNAPAAK